MADETKTERRIQQCNMHSDCDAADERAKARGERFGADHCHDDDCEDCYGK